MALSLSETNVNEIVTERAAATDLPLARRVRSGVAWNVSSSLIGELIRFVRSIALARLLVPEDFGLFGMALTIVAAVNAVTALGLDRTIVAQKFDSSEELKSHLDTVWSAELIRSLIIALLVAASALPISRFYGQAQLIAIVPLLGLISFIQGFQNIGLVLLRKEISFAKIFWYELVTNAFGLAITVALAVVLRNVWALVIGLLLTSAAGTLLSYGFHPYRPRLALERKALSRAWSMGKFMLIIAIASYPMNMADNVMVGRLLGSGALGNYSLAFNISSTPIQVLAFAFGAVLFPAYAELTTHRPKQLEQAFVKVFSLSLAAFITVALTFYLIGSDMVHVLFGSKWTTAGMVLPLLALIIPFRGFNLIVTPLFYAANRSSYVAVGRIIEAVVFLVLLYPFIKAFGLSGAAWAGLIAYAFTCLNRLIALRQIIPGVTSKLFRTSLISVVAFVPVVLIGMAALSFLNSPLPRMIIGGAILTIVPPLILLLVSRDLRSWVRESLS
jgi:lipopolysaccharide exporter